MHSAQAARDTLERLENEQRDMPRRIRNARKAKARADFDAAHGQYDPWQIGGTEEDLSALEARAEQLPRLIFEARTNLAAAELQDVAMELEDLESTEAERQEALAATAAELRRAMDAHERARQTDSAARQRMAAIKAGALPYRSNVLEALTSTGQ